MMADRHQQYPSPYSPHPGLSHARSGHGGGGSAAGGTAPNAWSYESAALAAYSHNNMAQAFPHHPHHHHYMQQLQNFSNFANVDRGYPPSHSVTVSSAAASATPSASVFNSSSGGNATPGGGKGALFGYPAGHPMGFDLSSYHRPLPAHSPLPSHMRHGVAPNAVTMAAVSANTATPGISGAASAPLPAHMRSNPYQPATSYHTLNANHSSSYPGSVHPSYLPPVPDSRYPSAAASVEYNKSQNPDKVNSDSRYLTNGGSPKISNSGNNGSRGYQQQPQHYGNPKEFVSKETSSSSKVHHMPNNNSVDNGHGHSTTSDLSRSSSSSSGPVTAGNDGFSGDAMAAHILNSMGGGGSVNYSGLQPSTYGLQTTALSSSSTSANASLLTSTTTAASPVVSTVSSNNDLKNLVHQPRGPSIAASHGQALTNSNGFAVTNLTSDKNLVATAAPLSLIASSREDDIKKENLIRKAEKSLFKRKSSMESRGTPPLKRLKELSQDSGEDPYSFDEEEKESVSSSVEFARFSVSGGRKSVAGGPVYKFKNALMSRGSRASSTDSRSSNSNTNKPIFDKSPEFFEDTCVQFIEDLQTKPISVSRKPNMDAYRERLAAKKEKNANRGRKKKVVPGSEGTEGHEVSMSEQCNNSSVLSDSSEPPQIALNVPKQQPPNIFPKPDDNPSLPVEEEKSPRKNKKKSPSKKNLKKDSPNKNNNNNASKVVNSEVSNQHNENPPNGQVSSINNKAAAESKAPATTKKGGLWALPIVPKLPQKAEKRRSSPLPPPVTKAAKENVDLCDVWRRAFGGVKPKKPAGGTASSTEVPLIIGVKQEADLPKQKTYLDIPPEVRRRQKPAYGGLIHFPPDWQQREKNHREKNRLPPPLMSRLSYVKPKILSGESPTPPILKHLSSAEESDAPSISPPSCKYITPKLLPASKGDLSPPKLSAEYSSPILNSLIKGLGPLEPSNMSIVDSILAKRKERFHYGRMYKVPFKKEKEKRKKSFDRLPEDGIGLLPTPGLPLLTEDTTEVLMGANFGNFRRQTLLRYFDSMEDAAELKAKILDWKPEVLETKTRRQSNKVKVVTSYREIFGIDLPTQEEQQQLKEMKEEASSSCSSTPKKSKKNNKLQEENVSDSAKKEEKGVEIKEESKETPNKKEEKDSPKKNKKKVKLLEKADESDEISLTEKIDVVTEKGKDAVEEDEDRPPTEKEENLQVQLQNFALDLLDDNLSWANKAVIQNLVIWEPIGPVIPEKKVRKKPKKHRKRQSGLDFSSSAKKKGRSRDISRAGSPIDKECKEAYNVTYNLDNVINESRGWVIDKGAGETILHRAAKMGYPDVVAYALDIANMPPTIKDNAGIPPIHKAAFKGHSEIVKILLKYGVDPNTNVKGTRPLHEALEGGHIDSVYNLLSYGSDPLLYDYSGNMPIDIAEGDENLKRYLTAVLADLHGKPGERWNVSHSNSYSVPPEVKLPPEAENAPAVDNSSSLHDASSDDDEDVFSNFIISSHPLPPFYLFPDKQGKYVLASDVKQKLDLKKFSTIQMSWEELVKTSRCNLLGHSKPHHKPQDIVELVFLDQNLKKLLGVEGLSPIKSPPKSRRS